MAGPALGNAIGMQMAQRGMAVISFDLTGVLDVLANQELLLGVFLAGTGLVFMLFGFRIFRSLVGVSFGVLGFVLFSLLPVDEELRLPFAFLGALALGAASTFMVRGAMIALAGAWGGVACLMLVGRFDLPMEVVLSLALIAAVCAGGMACILYQETIALVLSLEGSMLFIAGLVVFANQNPTLWIHVREMLLNNGAFTFFAILTGTVTGLYWQLAELRQCSTGTSA